MRRGALHAPSFCAPLHAPLFCAPLHAPLFCAPVLFAPFRCSPLYSLNFFRLDNAYNMELAGRVQRAPTGMKYDSGIHHRRSIRLRGYDYSQNGLYFITICCNERQPIFGEVVGDEMCLNDAGRLAHEEWEKTGTMRENIELHEFIVMPNHIHGIIEIAVGAHCMRPDVARPDVTDDEVRNQAGRNQGRVQRAPTVGDIVRGYKSSVTKRINQLRKMSNSPVWQRNYYEHIIRNEEAYLKIAEYIQTNPQRWNEDTYHV